MTLKVQTVRLPEEDIKDLEKLTEELKEDKASIVRRALRIGIDELRLREDTGLGYRELHAEIKRRGVVLRYPEDDLREV